jgi:hypothetical protein
VLSWYVATATLGSSIGTEVVGRIVEHLQQWDGWTIKDAYHSIFWLYAAIGLLNMAMVLVMSDRSEASTVSKPAEEGIESNVLLDDMDSDAEEPATPKPVKSPTPMRKKGGLLAQISPETRRVMYKLSSLFALDSVGLFHSVPFLDHC